MENELRIIAGLDREQLVERASALQLEVEYWQLVLDDRAKVNTALRDGTRATMDATASAICLATLVHPSQLSIVETLIEQLRRAVDALSAVADAEASTLELAVGRKTALAPIGLAIRRAAGLEPDGDEPSEQS
jgi:hypothetical protein